MSPFTIVIIIVVVVLIVMVISYMFSDPYTLQGVNNGQSMVLVKSTSLATNGSNVPLNNFAYSIWFYVNNWNYRYGAPKVIFGRMGAPAQPPAGADSNSCNGSDPCPSVVLGATENNIDINLSCYSGLDEEPVAGAATPQTTIKTCSVSNVPIQRWVNLILSVYGRSMDIYIDGKLVSTCLLPGIANVNNDADVYVTPCGGFEGWTAKFQFYPSPLNPQQAWNIYTQGYSSWLSMLNAYQIQLSLVENGETKSSVTI
jgi:hypothetical protein